MIVGILTLFMSLFGIGSTDVFYMDKIEEGINKEIKDKDRKKDLKNIIKDYKKTVKEFNKARSKQLKDLRQKNLERSTSEEWYVEFYESRMEEKIELEKTFIEQRIALQEEITEEEWSAIVSRSMDASTKQKEKEEKKKSKQKDKNAFALQEKAIVENVSDRDRRMVLLDALSVFESTYENIHNAYVSINIDNAEFLSDKYALAEDMLILAEKLNEQRLLLYKGNTVFLMVMKEYATEEEWKPIMKAYNKLFQL